MNSMRIGVASPADTRRECRREGRTRRAHRPDPVARSHRRRESRPAPADRSRCRAADRTTSRGRLSGGARRGNKRLSGCDDDPRRAKRCGMQGAGARRRRRGSAARARDTDRPDATGMAAPPAPRPPRAALRARRERIARQLWRPRDRGRRHDAQHDGLSARRAPAAATANALAGGSQPCDPTASRPDRPLLASALLRSERTERDVAVDMRTDT